MTLSMISSNQAREVGDRMLKEKQVQDTRDITSGINPFLVQSSKEAQEIFLNLRMRALTLSTTGGRDRKGGNEKQQDQRSQKLTLRKAKGNKIRGFKVETGTQKLKSQYESSAKQTKN